MIRTDKLRGIITERGLTQKDVAEYLNIVPKTFYGKMAKGVFGSDEIQIMIEKLGIENPMDIFFAEK